MNTAFLDSLDIANFGLLVIGERRIQAIDEDSKANSTMAFAYEKCRQPELRRNVWRFSLRKVVLRPVDDDTRRLDPQPWDAETTYLPGAIVKDDNGVLWTSDEPDNIGTEPGAGTWRQYFGPLSVSLYDEDTTYHSGELVYVIVGDGGFVVFRSLNNANEDVPGTATAYDADTTYARNDVVSYGGYQWRSLIVVNLGTTPAVGPNDYDPAVSYSTGNTVTASDGYIYSSVGNSNLGHDPATDTAGTYWTNTDVPNAWAKTPEIYPSSSKWLPVYAGLDNLKPNYPVGIGPATQIGSSNIYLLPANWLGDAPQNPGMFSANQLGGPNFNSPRGWEFIDEYLIAPEPGPLLYRFVADMCDVKQMDAMFCQALGCAMASVAAEDLTQQTSKVADAVGRYNKVMGDARLKNAIEQGIIESEDDEYVLVRL